jgi:hypothetical protein
MADILKNMIDELDEAVELLRLHYPHDDERELRERGRIWVRRKYELGKWPEAEIAERVAAERVAAERAAAALADAA